MNKYSKGKRAKKGTARSAAKPYPNENPNSYVLSTLLKAKPHYVSGSILAEKLNMSRVGIWSRIEKLRNAGLSIEASQNLGYRLAGEPNHLNAPLLDAWFQQCDVKCNFRLFNSTGSTNTEAEKLMTEGGECTIGRTCESSNCRSWTKGVKTGIAPKEETFI